jgi:hypothetical protein
MVWINTCSDGVHYTYASKYFYLSHKTSAPLFLLLGHAFLWIPIGTEFWRVGLISVFSTFTASIFIYLIIKQLVGKRWLQLLGALMYGSSAMVISQSTIVETYPLVTMLCVAAYYFALKRKWSTSSLMMALGLAVHHLIGLVIVPLLVFNKELRNPKQLLIMASGLLFYLYIPISVRVFNSPDMWGNQTASSFFGDNLSTMIMLVGGISIWDIPKRILDAVGLMGVSLGLGFVLVIWYLVKEKKVYKNQLFWLFILGIVYYITDLAPQTAVYVMPSIAFGVIIAMIQLSKVNRSWLYATAVVASGLLLFNANYMDIGRTLDPNLSATEFYNKELAKIPDGNILMAQYGWEWAMIYPYDKNESRNIIPVDIDTLVSPIYQKQLKAQGIKLEDNFNKDLTTRQAFIASSIVELNDNVWTTRTTNSETYGVEVIKAKDYPQLVNKPVNQIQTTWRWKPSNPYGIITGSIEVKEWNHILWSNKNANMVIGLGIIFYSLYWLLMKQWDKRKYAIIQKAQ